MSALRHRLHCHRRVALSRHCGISYCLSLIYVRLQNRCFIAPRLQRAGVRKTARCHCVEQHHAGSVCDRLVTRPSPTRSGLARDLNSCSQRKCCAIDYRALVELVFDRQARSGAVCKARSSTAQGAHETVVKGLSNIRPWTARVLVRAKEHRRGGVRGGIYTPHPTCPAGALTFNTSHGRLCSTR